MQALDETPAIAPLSPVGASSLELHGMRFWRDSRELGDGARVEVRFVGQRSGDGREDRARVLEALEGGGAPPLAWAKQIHSDHFLSANPGFCGEGDALVAEEPDLALCVVTADCVPVLVAGRRHLAAIHAGWRGIASSIIARTLESWPAEDLDGATAWIGPAIGPCCYEVGSEVAEPVVAVGGPEVARPGPRGKPHLDLQRAARRQLEALGFADVRTIDMCTRCHPDELYSYRRNGAQAGRNLSVIWRRGEEGAR